MFLFIWNVNLFLFLHWNYFFNAKSDIRFWSTAIFFVTVISFSFNFFFWLIFHQITFAVFFWVVRIIDGGLSLFFVLFFKKMFVVWSLTRYLLNLIYWLLLFFFIISFLKLIFILIISSSFVKLWLSNRSQLDMFTKKPHIIFVISIYLQILLAFFLVAYLKKVLKRRSIKLEIELVHVFYLLKQ